MPDPPWPIDPPVAGLLCALVLAPTTLPRNRFFWLFARPEAREVRRRAAELRSVIRHLAGRSRCTIELVELSPCGDDGRLRLRYVVSELRLDRTLWLAPLELALVRTAMDRIVSGLGPAELDRAKRLGALLEERLLSSADDRQHVDAALYELWRALSPSDAETTPDEPTDSSDTSGDEPPTPSQVADLASASARAEDSPSRKPE